MKNFINTLKKNRDISFAIMGSIIVILAILILVYEPFKEVPFIYNQF
ncbi:hypothetical protein [Clostridium beijerinckii]|nr:hypothetical protein [Clostridium beijerinckii]